MSEERSAYPEGKILCQTHSEGESLTFLLNRGTMWDPRKWEDEEWCAHPRLHTGAEISLNTDTLQRFNLENVQCEGKFVVRGQRRQAIIQNPWSVSKLSRSLSFVTLL